MSPNMRPPVVPTLELPAPRRRTGWAFGLSLALHLALVAFLRSDAGRAWVRTLAPGPVALVQRGGGGGGGGRGRGVADIFQPGGPAPPPVGRPER